MGRYTSLLYTTPTFVEGLGRIVDVLGVLDVYNTSGTTEEADRAALASDWWAIGEDFRDSIRKVADGNRIEIRDGE